MKNYNYKCIIDNTIKYTLLNDISDKSCEFYRRNSNSLNKKISLQEGIETLKSMEKDNSWPVTERVLLLSAVLLKVEDGEVSTNDIFNHPHDTDDDLLLVTVLCDMRESTLRYKKT